MYGWTMNDSLRPQLIAETVEDIEWTIRTIETYLEHLSELEQKLAALGVPFDTDTPSMKHLRHVMAAYAA